MIRITERTVFDGYTGWLNNGVTYRLACGQLGYPDAIILDGRLVFAYDRDRRQIRFVEVGM